MDIGKEQSYWVVFCKGVLSGAAFLTSFGSLDSVDAFIMGFQYHDLSIPALPMVMEREIYGMGFALACDFLREAGYRNYGKPDVHVKDILFGLEIVEYRDNYEVFKALLRMARVSDELPVIVDKVLYLIGSGNIGKPDIKIGRQKKVFIEEMQAKLAGFDTDLGNGRREDGEGADWLTWFVVAPEYRGKEDGLVAAKMLRAVITELKRRKVKKVFVATLSSDARALRFYLKHGFEMEARLCDYYYRDEDQLILGRYL
jgi:hypothetical protein